WDVLNSFTGGIDQALEPLSRRRMNPGVPARWKPHTFRDQGFLYLWNMTQTKWAANDPKHVGFPYHIADKEVREAFEKKYAGASEVPIFSDPRIVPTFHGSGPQVLASDAADPAVKQGA